MNLFKRDIIYFVKTENHLQYPSLNALTENNIRGTRQ